MAEKIRKKIQDESNKIRAEEAKIGKEITDAGNNLRATLRKAEGKSSVKVDDNEAPDD
jgi:hypothetical protein